MNHRPVLDQLRRAFQISGVSEWGLVRRAHVSPHCRLSRCAGTQVFLWLPWSDSRSSHAIDPAAYGCLLPVSSRTPATDHRQQSLAVLEQRVANSFTGSVAPAQRPILVVDRSYEIRTCERPVAEPRQDPIVKFRVAAPAFIRPWS